ncbi:Rqc2 family fibronectin-binding protein [Halothermothrix orenii]|uniref:Rqc2 homolog RqcH n=1 Tax=Halothermothrix orenii (strain H 168 / OCM 544 / DSM 9562) TaxID=373903 RepID=B8CWR5_HALOH|nr:NFACT RNA binding domain-containing protein [Halothermothrix orenii]ACL69734.1 Fibronectin-binding A domain protein [Halothermothrix orenii H 168]
MALDGIMLAAIKKELTEELQGARVDKIYQPEADNLTFTLRQPGQNINLFISAGARNPRIHITSLKFKNPLTPPAFCMLLRKYLINGTIGEIKQPDFERILEITINKKNNIYRLIIEIMGRHSNIILTDDNGYILDAIKRITKEVNTKRELYPGIKYHYPPRQDKLNPLKVTREEFFKKIPDDFSQSSFKAIMYNFRGIGPNMAKEIVYRSGLDHKKPYGGLSPFERNKLWDGFNNIFRLVIEGKFKPTIGIDNNNNICYFSAFPLEHNKDIKKDLIFDNTASLFDYYYENKIKLAHIGSIKNSLIKVVSNYLKKNRKKRNKLRKQLNESKRADEYKKIGELIKANMYILTKGMKQAEVIDYFSPGQEKTNIKLDPKLSPSENAQRYFKKYNKAKKGVKYIKRELRKLKHEERYLEQVMLNLEQAESREEIREIKEELGDEGYIKKKNRINNRRKQQKPLPPLRFKATTGHDILVGRNNRQNDKLSKKIANNQDLWLHVKELPGSHVIIRNHTGDEIPTRTIKEAAIIAAYYSKGRMSENVPVDYTEIKHVKKPKGAKPGLVYYENYKTIYVNPDKKIIEKLAYQK